jgi:DDE superfamily endonuclease
LAAEKKPKGQALNVSDKILNQILSGVRIVVEHAIAGVKRCRIVKDEFRNTKAGFTDLVMEVACALHNLRMDFRHPVPTLDILALVG